MKWIEAKPKWVKSKESWLESFRQQGMAICKANNKEVLVPSKKFLEWFELDINTGRRTDKASLSYYSLLVKDNWEKYNKKYNIDICEYLYTWLTIIAEWYALGKKIDKIDLLILSSLIEEPQDGVLSPFRSVIQSLYYEWQSRIIGGIVKEILKNSELVDRALEKDPMLIKEMPVWVQRWVSINGLRNKVKKDLDSMMNPVKNLKIEDINLRVYRAPNKEFKE